MIIIDKRKQQHSAMLEFMFWRNTTCIQILACTFGKAI